MNIIYITSLSMKLEKDIFYRGNYCNSLKELFKII